MKMKLFIKFITIFTIIILLFSWFSVSYAIEPIENPSRPRQTSSAGGAGTSSGSISSSSTIDPTSNPDYYKPVEGSSDKLTDIGKTILAVINVVGVIVAVAALAIIGLRYMFGSVEERANYKETMVPYIVGLVMLGGITSIVNIIYNIASNIGK